MKFSTPVNNIRMERNMSQILYIGPIVGKKTKRENLGYFLKLLFLHFDKTKNRTYITNLRHCSLHMHVIYEY